MLQNSAVANHLVKHALPAGPWLWGAMALVVLVAFHFLFGDSIRRVASMYSKPEFSHGFIIPLITLWLLWQRRALIWELRGPGATSGWLLVAVGVGIALLAHAGNIDSMPYLGLIPLVIGLAVATLGWPAGRLFIVPVGFLLFGFPLPDTSYVLLSTTLQLLSSQIGAGVLHALGVPVLLEGNIIDLGTFKLQVAEACSGLRYMLPLLSFGVLCAYMYRAPVWAKILVILATIPLTVLLNGFRIALTGIFVEYGNAALAEGFMHLFEGWVIFLIALAILFGLMWLILRLSGQPSRLVDMLDFDRMAGMPEGRRPHPPAGASPARAAPTVLPRTAVAAVITLAIGAILLVPLSQRGHTSPDRPGLNLYPLQLQGWAGVPARLDAVTETALAADDYLLVDYVDGPSNEHVNLWVAYYASLLEDGAQVHPPTTCLPGAGWEYTEFGRYRTAMADFSGQPLIVNRGVIAKGTSRLLLYFWLELRGEHALGNEARLRNLWDSFTIGRSDGALVRVYTTLEPNETPADGDARLQRFLTLAYPHLEPHVGRGS